MTRGDLSKLLTVEDLEHFHLRIIKDVKELLVGRNPHKEFYSPKEFCNMTGEKYSTVLYKCKIGRLKARQDAPGCTWQIFASERERYKKEANEIYTDQ